jgi:hypothetical protein
MPRSSQEGKEKILQWIRSLDVTNVCDVGPGCGTYIDLCKNAGLLKDANWTGLEVWEPYIKKFNLAEKYDRIILSDVRQVDLGQFDLVIFGDVLEHMTREEAKKCVESASQAWRILSIPTTHYPQAEVFGNPFERHVEENWDSNWVFEDFDSVVDSQLGKISVYLLRPTDPN